jgi:hypothetical protein
MKLIWIKLSLEFSSFCVCSKSFSFIDFCMFFNSMKREGDLNGLNNRTGVISRSLWGKYAWKHTFDIPLPHTGKYSVSFRDWEEWECHNLKQKPFYLFFWIRKELGSLVKNPSLKQRDILHSSCDMFTSSSLSEEQDKSTAHHNISKQHPATAKSFRIRF